MNPKSDEIYRDPRGAVMDFVFDKNVVAVFDDMVSRSVPFYPEIQRMVAELGAAAAVEGSCVYDLGCSSGTTLAALHPLVPPGVQFVGIDNSPDMLERTAARFREIGVDRPLRLASADLNQPMEIANASLVTLVLTLQFVRPLNRERLITDIHRGLNADGSLILVEKVVGEDPRFNRQFIDFYYEMKRRHGYSELEISQKREALENVLVPYTLQENLQLLARAGFRRTEVFFKWYNFCGIVATK
jgi:tRNA (cmo5U34)-methyltransferase